MSLQNLGWTAFFEQAFESFAARGLAAGRVATESREIYRLLTADGELAAELLGALRYRAHRHRTGCRADLPVVGDWVAFQAFGGNTGIVHAVLPRSTSIARRAAGTSGELQVLAANVDTVLVVSSLNQDLNPRRLERYLALVRQSCARPVVVLSKADLAAASAPLVRSVEAVAAGAPVLTVSALQGTGIDALAGYLRPGETVALLGSSGVGKSTLVNALLGRDRQVVAEIRAGDDRGRHATTCRELIPLPGGGLLLDTPGLRELGLAHSEAMGAEEALAEVFDDIEALAAGCRFRDCRHQGEPGCAVEAAVAGGRLDAARKAGYDKLRREESFLADRAVGGAAYAEKKRWKALHARHKTTLRR